MSQSDETGAHVDVTDLVLRLVRRWIATTVVVVLAGLAAVAALSNAGSVHQSTAAVVIVPPVLGEAVSEQNPLLNLGDSLAQLATVLASAINAADPSADGDAEGAAGGDATFTISTVVGDNPSFARLTPQLTFTVTAPTPEQAESTSTALVALAGDRLDELQTEAGVPSSSRARLVTVVDPTPAQSAGGNGLRAAGAVGVGVGVLGLLVVLLGDELLVRRRRRRRLR